MQTLAALTATLPKRGRVTWLGVRSTRGEPMQIVNEVEARRGYGLTGDRFKARRTTREVTLFQQEHLAVLGSVLGLESVAPELLRRNIGVTGINVLALRTQRFLIGQLLFEGTGAAHPCSRMEQALGPGGYNAMRGHGGITARLLSSGIVRLGDEVELAPAQGGTESGD